MSDLPLLTWKGRRVRSPGEGPESSARKVPAAPLRPGSLFFVPSPLEGWGLDLLLHRLPADGAVVVLEKDPELWTHCSEKFWETLAAYRSDPRLFVLAADTEQAVQDLFESLPLERLRRCEFLTLNGAWLADRDRYRQVYSRLEQGLARWWSNRMTIMHMGPLWVRNLLGNLSRSDFEARDWPDWGQQTVLVVGAGVSLEETIPWARRHRGALKMVAADTALPVLKAAGLVPDAVVCLEAQHANLRDFSGWVGCEIELFADLVTFPPANRVFSRAPRWFASEFASLSMWKDGDFPAVPRLPALGSVGVAAVGIAWKLTRGTVILSGLDFSFPIGRTHARGAPALDQLLCRTDRLKGMEQVGSWNRPGVREHRPGWLTTPVLEGYAQVLADLARGERHRTWNYGSVGLPLGVESWPAGKAPPPPATAPSPQESMGDRQAAHPIQPWLAKQVTLWKSILEDFGTINKEPTPSDWNRLRDRLTRADYLTFFFPDPEYRAESDWLIRAQAQVRWALDRLGEV